MMPDDLDEEYQKARQLAQKHLRKDVDGFRQRRGLELVDLLRTEREKPQGLQDKAKIEWILKELQQVELRTGD